jgi:hypothetical protein
MLAENKAYRISKTMLHAWDSIEPHSNWMCHSDSGVAHALFPNPEMRPAGRQNVTLDAMTMLNINSLHS